MALMFAIGIAALVLVACSELGRTGRRVNAVREDPELAASLGIRVRRYRLVALLVSGALGGCAGCLNILVRSTVSPLDIGFGLIVLALTMIIVGGALLLEGRPDRGGHLHLAARLLTVIGEWQELIYGIIVARRGDPPPARHLRPLRRLAAGPCSAAPRDAGPARAAEAWRAKTTRGDDPARH